MALTLPIGLLFFICINIRNDLFSTKQTVLSQEEGIDVRQISQDCDQTYCDSVVNKCKLTNKCSCDWEKDALCSKECVECLEEKYGRCCGCVG